MVPPMSRSPATTSRWSAIVEITGWGVRSSNSLELVKTTSIAALVALPELLRSARVAQEQTYNPTPLTAAAVIFFVMLWPFARWVAKLERNMLLRQR